MESDDKPWRHGMGRRGQKRGKRADSQPDITDALCNAALDYQKSVGFQHHSASIPTHFSGPPTLLQRKRLHGARSPTPGASASSPGRSRAGSPTDSLFKDQELDKDVIRGNRKSSVQLSGEDMELDDPSISTKIGRYRAWHPEDSFVTEVHPVLPPIFPTLEEMQAQYKPPLRRLRSRLDGFGGAVLFQHPEEAPPGVEAAIAKVIPLPKGCMETCDFPDRGRWNVILEGQQKKSLKRPLTAAASTSSSTKSDTGTADAEGATKKRKEEERPDPRVDLVLDYIKTGDDCVRFFMENEGRNRVKVFYCNRAKTAKAYQPYDMVVVPRAKIEDEHFSFSFDGVVHVETRIGNRKNAIFTPLEEWMREKYVFSLLRRIPFFGNYYTQKSFNIWRRHIGQRHFSRVRDALIKKLFFAKPAFLSALCQIYAHVESLSELAMLNLTTNRLYNYDEFANLQTEQRLTSVSPAMEAVTEKVQEIIATICQEAKKQAKIYRESVRDEAELDDTIGVNLHQTRGSKVQSMVVNNAMDGVVQVVQSAPRILHMRVFLPFLEAKYVGMNPHSIIKMTPFFTQLREAIDHVVRSDFDEARKYAQIFEQHRALHSFGETWSFETYAAEKHTVRQYREELARQREWRIDLERMRTAK